ncbi:hypothetical protein B0J13DRAFT_113401 [Dactylonectria estremocensis]|uniref:Uncharacterized protein n=1 Tax=Dactylonectria estremocensis TaxID=1079267 RepID=A0A9P9FDH3_9HYPO|nr:hypothetical protein B0J13DRAFT_113401 [Dactylonectria estremocensis]
MTVPSHFHMPGAFHGEGVHPGLFRPPISPSSSASYGYAAPRATASVDSHTKRKRHRHEISRSQEMPTVDDDVEGNGYFTTPGVQNRHRDRHYQLAGQLDTPSGGPAGSNLMDESMYSDSDYRRALGSRRTCDEMDHSMTGPTQLFNFPTQPVPAQGWGSFAFSTIGGVVGKVWQFCKAGAFRGFQAGGGRAFRVTAEGVRELHSLDEDPVQDHHVPGRFPQMDYQQDPMDERIDSGASTPTRPAAKRRHTDHRDELGRNWVIVGDSQPAPEANTPQRRPHRPTPTPRSRNNGPSMATGRRISTPASRPASRTASRPASRLSATPTPGGQRRQPASRPASRLSHAPSPPMLSPLPASTASFASFGSYGAARSPSPTKIPQPSFSSRRRNSVAPSPSPAAIHGHRRSHSNASTASNRGSVEQSPRLTVEAKHLAARRKMEERDADVRISAFNKQLQDMIRQGKEALGTTIEVEGTWEDDD